PSQSPPPSPPASTATTARLDPNTPAGAQAADAAVFYYVGDYFNNLVQARTADPAIVKDADPSLVSTLENNAGADFGASSLPDPVTSTAQPVGCSYTPSTRTVKVRIDWTYQSAGQAAFRDFYFTDTVPLHVVNNQWKVAGILPLPNPSAADVGDSSLPAGFVSGTWSSTLKRAGHPCHTQPVRVCPPLGLIRDESRRGVGACSSHPGMAEARRLRPCSATPATNEHADSRLHDEATLAATPHTRPTVQRPAA